MKMRAVGDQHKIAHKKNGRRKKNPNSFYEGAEQKNDVRQDYLAQENGGNWNDKKVADLKKRPSQKKIGTCPILSSCLSC